MFIGHFAVGFASKKFSPQLSLGTAFIACQLLDLLWPIFLLTGIERAEISPGITALTPFDFVYYPYTHSLLFAFLWSVVFAGGYYLLRRDSRGSLVCALLVLSHWLLDLLVHRPDLPIYPGGPVAGLGLWNQPVLETVIELSMFTLGVISYLSQTDAKDKIGKYALASLILLFVLIHAANILGPPPPDMTSVAIAGNLMWIFVVMGFWIDRHRKIKGRSLEEAALVR